MLKFTIRHKNEDGTLNLIDIGQDGEMRNYDVDLDGNPIVIIEADTDISRQLDLNDGVIEYHMQREWTEDYLEEKVFCLSSMDEMGHVTFVPIPDVGTAGEWGVDVVYLSERKYAYRTNNPMNDGEWSIGNLDDVADCLNEVESSWYLFIFNGKGMEYTRPAK
jgi:hypothetical protein